MQLTFKKIFNISCKIKITSYSFYGFENKLYIMWFFYFIRYAHGQAKGNWGIKSFKEKIRCQFNDWTSHRIPNVFLSAVKMLETCHLEINYLSEIKKSIAADRTNLSTIKLHVIFNT